MNIIHSLLCNVSSNRYIAYKGPNEITQKLNKDYKIINIHCKTPHQDAFYECLINDTQGW